MISTVEGHVAKSRHIANPSSWTMLVFGAMAAVLGAVGLINPEFQIESLGFEHVARSARASHDYTLVFALAGSMASLNIGAYYVLAALHNMKRFYAWTVPFRCLTVTIFTLAVVRGIAPSGFLTVPAWELVGALATGFALIYEKRKGIP